MLPPFLKSNDLVAIISPSGSIDEKFIDGATKVLQSWGLRVKEMPHARGNFGRFAAERDARLADLQEAMNDKEVNAILCSRGGYGMVQIIEDIDPNFFEINPKWILGFSDITVLHSMCSAVDIASIHSIMAKHLTQLPMEDESVVTLKNLLFGEMPKYQISSHQLNRIGKVKAKIVGGNLSVLYGLRGTHLDIEYLSENPILFLEDVGERPYHIDRMMHNLRLGGVLENISGLIVGQFSDYEEDESMGKMVYEIIADAVKDYNYPVCFNFPAGHVERNLPLVFGSEATLMVGNENVTLEF